MLIIFCIIFIVGFFTLSITRSGKKYDKAFKEEEVYTDADKKVKPLDEHEKF